MGNSLLGSSEIIGTRTSRKHTGGGVVCSFCGAEGSQIGGGIVKVFSLPVEFKQTAGKWHVQVWHGHSKTFCGKHVEFDYGRIQYSGGDVAAKIHPICCKNCAKQFITKAVW